MVPPFQKKNSHKASRRSDSSGGSRISPRRGRQLRRGAPTYDFAKIFPKTAWNWKNLDRGGVPHAPLRSATGYIVPTKACNFVSETICGGLQNIVSAVIGHINNISVWLFRIITILIYWIIQLRNRRKSYSEAREWQLLTKFMTIQKLQSWQKLTAIAALTSVRRLKNETISANSIDTIQQ